MRIMVTGSRGVIGQSLVPRLRYEGHRVIEFDKRIQDQYDVQNRGFLHKFVGACQPNIIIHMAAQVGRLTAEYDPKEAFRTNIEGTYNVIDACHQSGARLINFSTSEVYGHNSVFGDPDVLEQNGIYGISKLSAEAIVKHYVMVADLKALSIRPFMVYGPHEMPNGQYRSAVSNFIDTAMNDGTIEAHEGCVRSWCYIDDFMDGLLLLIEKHKFEYKEYCAFSIGTEEYRTMEECAQIVIDTVGSGRYIVKPVPAKLVSAVKKANFDYMHSLGFEPKVGLEEGIRRTYEWMRGEL